MLRRLLPLTVLVLSACQAPIVWHTVDTDIGFGRLWDRFSEVATVEGYPPDADLTDRGTREYVSIWHESSAPIGKDVERTRLHAFIDRSEEDAERWLLKFYVERQVVDTFGRRFDVREEDWGNGGQAGVREEVILGKLRLDLGQDLGIQPTHQRDR